MILQTWAALTTGMRFISPVKVSRTRPLNCRSMTPTCASAQNAHFEQP